MTTHDSRTTPADRAIVEAVIAAWMQMRHGPTIDATAEPVPDEAARLAGPKK